MTLFRKLYSEFLLEEEKIIGPMIVDGYFEVEGRGIAIEVYAQVTLMQMIISLNFL